MTAGDLPRFVITGPTGWIGSALLAHLARRLGPGWHERVTLFATSARRHDAPDGTAIALRALDSILPADVDDAIVLHLAYLTKEKAEQVGERRFTDTNLAIDDLVLSAICAASPRGLFVASSGAAALAESGQDRHPYGMTKLRQEDRFLDWATTTGVPLLVGRIFNLAGPYINKIHSYAISSFLWQARNTGVIRIDARRPVYRSFLHVDDLSRLALGALERGFGAGSPIDLCGAEVLEMGDIARVVADYVGGGVTVERGSVDVDAPSSYLGDFTKTKGLALRLGADLAPFIRQVADTEAGMFGKRNETRSQEVHPTDGIGVV